MRIDELITRYKFVRIIEVTPPRYRFGVALNPRQMQIRIHSWMEMVRSLGLYCDGIAIADLKETQACHLPPSLLAKEVKREAGIEVMPSLALRDYSKGALLNTVVGCISVGITNLLIVRGDPHQEGEKLSGDLYGFSKVAEALRLIKKMVGGTRDDMLCIATSFDHNLVHDDKYIRMLKEREPLVDLYIDQPFFRDPEEYLELIDIARSLGITKPILHSIFPLLDKEDMNRAVMNFGWRVSEQEKAQLTEGQEAGIKIASQKFEYLFSNRKKVDGVYISSRNRPELVRLILSGK